MILQKVQMLQVLEGEGGTLRSYGFSRLTQLVVQRPCGQERMDPEFQEVPDRSRSLVLPVIGQDLLDHEAPVAVSSAVRVNFRGVVIGHLQRMLKAAAGHKTTDACSSFRGPLSQPWCSPSAP